MAQRAKQWLARQSESFRINPRDGGIAGSLIGLGFVEKQVKQTQTGPIETGAYVITEEGKQWTRNQRGQL